MKKKFAIYPFTFGTITEKENLVTIEIERTQFSHDDPKERTELLTNEDPLFLDKESVVESETSLFFSYRKSSRLKNLTCIKNEAYPVKLSIAQEVLKQDILQKYTKEGLSISLHPATIYYHPMQTVRYTYAATSFMPREPHTAIERYRALTVSILSSIAYEKCLNSPADVRKEGNELVKEIYQQATVSDLLALIQQSNDFITYDYIENRRKTEQTIKTKYRYMIGGIVALSLASLSVVGTQISGRASERTADYHHQLEEKDILLRATESFYNDDYEEAILLFEQIDYDQKQLAMKLIEKEQYQHALDVDSSSLEGVIKALYANEQSDILLDLKGNELEKPQQMKLVDEKGIAAGDSQAMLHTLNFLKDEDTGIRLAKKFIELQDLTHAQQIADRYPENKVLLDQIQQAKEEKELQEQEEIERKKQIEEKKKQVNESTDEKETKQLQKELDALLNP